MRSVLLRWAPAVGVAVALALLLVPAIAQGSTDFDELRARGWHWAYLGVLLAGLLTALTPCVYPMIPIVLGIFGARGENVPRSRALLLATAYVVGMGTMFSGLGVGAALAGRVFSTFLGNPWFVVPLVLFYVALAASMFGAYELRLPTGLQDRLSTVGGKGMAGAFGMGLVGGLTAAPCTGPILLGILGFVATTRNVPVGFTLLFTYAIGIGVLFWVLALFAVSLPKSGRWMDAVKSVGGVALLVVAAYFLRPIWPALTRLTSPEHWFLGVSAGAAAIGIALGAIHLSFHGGAAEKLRKSTGLILCTAGLIGALNWVLTPRNPLPWRLDPEVALAEAREQRVPVLLDFGAEWCAPCKEYETRVFADPAVYEEVTGRFLSVKYDFTKQDDRMFDILEAWRAGLPTVILLDGEGNERSRFSEPIPSADQFLRALRDVP
jgi:thioredoxin:protein disulfide reductase